MRPTGMLRLTAASMWARRRRLVGTSIAVVLGVAFLTGTLVLGDTLKANFDRLFTEVSAGTDVVVRNATVVDPGSAREETRGLIDESLLRRVQQVDGVDRAEPQVLGYGSLPESAIPGALALLRQAIADAGPG